MQELLVIASVKLMRQVLQMLGSIQFWQLGTVQLAEQILLF